MAQVTVAPPSRFVRLARLCNRHRWRTFGVWLLALILIQVAAALGDDRVIKLFGIGLASAVFFDAVIIRCLLVPGIMELLDRRAWWVPSWLDRRLPRIAIESPDAIHVPEPEPSRA